MPSLLCGILCIPAAFYLGRIVYSRGLGLAAAALVAVDPNMVDQSQQARMYTMLALVWMLAAAMGIGLLRSPPAERKPWILWGLVLSAALWVNFGAVALWSGLVVAALALIAIHRGDEGRDYSNRVARGMTTAFLTAGLVSVRGVYRFIRFIVDDHAPGTTGASDRFRTFWDGLNQLTSAGVLLPLAVLLAIVGLFLIWRRCQVAGIVLAATGAMAALMVYRGQTVHDVFAVRYFTALQPTLWMGLAAIPVALTLRYARALCTVALLLFATLQGWQAMHLERWNNFRLWEFVRTSADFIHQAERGTDFVACTPNIHLEWLARYYGLDPAVRGVPIRESLAERQQVAPSDERPLWMVAYVRHHRTVGELQEFLGAAAENARMVVDVERTIALCQDRGHVLLRLDGDKIDVWEYVDAANGLRPLPMAATGHLARASDRPLSDDPNATKLR
jgi:hypothetical protein